MQGKLSKQWVASEISRLEGKPMTDVRTVKAWLSVYFVISSNAPTEKASNEALAVIERLVRIYRVTRPMLRASQAKASSVLEVLNNE
jgi:hypothetical protein|tara:strand:- start:619 stop:879 length:261 start_codon:yes stop_codon:yes gene_type:complete